MGVGGGGGRGGSRAERAKKNLGLLMATPTMVVAPQNVEAAYGPEAYQEVINCTCIRYKHGIHHTNCSLTSLISSYEEEPNGKC